MLNALHGNLDNLKWIHQHRRPYKYQFGVFSFAARGGYLTILKWMYKHKCPNSEDAFANAAEHGDLTILKWMYAKNSNMID